MRSFVRYRLRQSGKHTARERIALRVLELYLGNAVGARHLNAAF
jgi:hypothetical protein